MGRPLVALKELKLRGFIVLEVNLMSGALMPNVMTRLYFLLRGTFDLGISCLYFS